MIDATPDFPAQVEALAHHAPAGRLEGILLTHAHIGHYTGLMHLGREVMGAHHLPVFAMPRMQRFLAGNGPWDQLIKLENIKLHPLEAGVAVALNPRMRVTPMVVPHRDEYSETVAFLVDGPNRSVLYLPDIDKWDRWDRRIEEMIARVDVAFVDGTFFDETELPGRDMAQIPHPLIEESLVRFGSLAPEQRAKVRFIHLNHTNPVLHPGSVQRRRIESLGMSVADVGERFPL